MADIVTAVDLARERNLDPRNLRKALREARLTWHQHGSRWQAPEGSIELREMVQVADSVQRRG